MDIQRDHSDEHVRKRGTAFGRWLPVALFAINMAGAVTTAVVVDAMELLYLGVFPLPAVALYVWRTSKG